MLNRIFYISGSVLQPGADLQGEDNVFMSIYIDPSDDGSLQNAYRYIAGTTNQYGLTLDIQQPLTAAATRFIVSFVMLPAYSRIGGRPVVNLASKDTALLDTVTDDLQSYLVQQGINAAIINRLIDQPATGNYYPLIEASHLLPQQYRSILGGERFYDNSLFIQVKSVGELEEAHAVLKKVETDFAREFPRLAELAIDKLGLEEKLRVAGAACSALKQELKNQQDYNALLRSGHSTRELQDYYNNEYEVLPTWYKRFGHILKVITGKRTFRSLFRDDVKKYKK